MKKIVVATAVLAAFSASAFAAAVPVTNINAGETKVAVEYSLSKKTAQDTKRKDGFGVSAQQGLSDNLAAQYSFNKVHRTGTDIKDHQLAGAYAVHPNIHVYGAGTYVDLGPKQNGFGYQAGVIGHTQLADKVEGFAKVGFGNDIKGTYQVGASYGLRPDIDLNVYYQYDQYNMNQNKTDVKGLHAGVGYSF